MGPGRPQLVYTADGTAVDLQVRGCLLQEAPPPVHACSCLQPVVIHLHGTVPPAYLHTHITALNTCLRPLFAHSGARVAGRDTAPRPRARLRRGSSRLAAAPAAALPAHAGGHNIGGSRGERRTHGKSILGTITVRRTVHVRYRYVVRFLLMLACPWLPLQGQPEAAVASPGGLLGWLPIACVGCRYSLWQPPWEHARSRDYRGCSASGSCTSASTSLTHWVWLTTPTPSLGFGDLRC